MDKARCLDCDAVILDLEDAVAPSAKDEARDNVVEAVTAGGFGFREVVVRINGLSTPWGATDLECFCDAPIDALLIPKVETIADIEAALATDLPVWVMIETPRGVLGLDDLLRAVERIPVVVMGTSDLSVELRTDDPRGLDYARAQCLLVSRANDRDILDGVHLEFRDLGSFRLACDAGRAMGFDGKTLIHPAQIDAANEVFGVSGREAEQFRAILRVWDEALAAGKGVVELDGRLVENLHAAQARRGLAKFEAARR